MRSASGRPSVAARPRKLRWLLEVSQAVLMRLVSIHQRELWYTAAWNS